MKSAQGLLTQPAERQDQEERSSVREGMLSSAAENGKPQFNLVRFGGIDPKGKYGPQLISSTVGTPQDIFTQSITTGAHYDSWVNRLMQQEGISREKAQALYADKYRDDFVSVQRDVAVRPMSAFEDLTGIPPPRKGEVSFYHNSSEIEYNPETDKPELVEPRIYMAPEKSGDLARMTELHERGHAYDLMLDRRTPELTTRQSDDPWNAERMKRVFPTAMSRAERRSAGEPEQQRHANIREEVYASLSAYKALKTRFGEPRVTAADVARLSTYGTDEFDNMDHTMAEAFMEKNYGPDWREHAGPGDTATTGAWGTNAGREWYGRARELRMSVEHDLREALMRNKSHTDLSDEEIADILNEITAVDLPDQGELGIQGRTA